MGKVLILGRVNHSQRSRETPLKTWILAEQNGTVITAHCNCMAGLCESCSNVGAVLYAIEAGVKLRNSITCTEEKAKWMPCYQRKVTYEECRKIDFTSAKRKKKMLDTVLEGDEVVNKSVKEKEKVTAVNLHDSTANCFFQKISQAKTKPQCLAFVPNYHKAYVPSCTKKCLPKPLTSYFDVKYANLKYSELLNECKTFSFELEERECKSIELETRKRAKSHLWFQHRAGRVTASNMKAAAHSDPTNPSRSLIKRICYPEEHQFSSKATEWGILHEDVAWREYEKAQQKVHDNFIVSVSGLQLNVKWPHLGATPDGIPGCDCCGIGTCEMKCPLCEALETIIAPNKCLVRDKDGNIRLNRRHNYYYQVQAQIHIMEVDYCDFVVWTTTEMHIERVYPDKQFWEETVEKVTTFFKCGILPELLAHWHSRPSA